jgi:diguanylate cyclase (GGDEF)-like protein
MGPGPDHAGRAAHRLLCGRIAGMLFSVAAVTTIPVNQLLVRPAVDGRVHELTAMALATGLVCLVVRWDRLPAGWLHVVPLLASVEVVLTMWGVGPHARVYVWFLVFIVVFCAFAFDRRGEVALHLCAVMAAGAYPLLTAPPADRANALAESLVAAPILLVAAGVVVHLRERLTAAVGALADQALSDPLTGVGNRRLLEARLDYEVTRHRRNGRPLSVLVLDLDGFKHVNDTLGHPAGDQLLREVAAVLCATVREQDTVVRQGGDELCVVAPETDAAEGAALAERIKAALRHLDAGGAPLSASTGVATFPQDAASAELLLAHADDVQRADKAAGRARVPAAPPRGLDS